MVSLAKYTITESRANVIVARALFFEHVFLAFLDIFELPATRPRPAALRQLFGSQAPANRLTPAAGSALAHCCARRTAHPSPRARRPPLLHPRDAAQEASPHPGRRPGAAGARAGPAGNVPLLAGRSTRTIYIRSGTARRLWRTAAVWHPQRVRRCRAQRLVKPRKPDPT